jgi:hypothetical protein
VQYDDIKNLDKKSLLSTNQNAMIRKGSSPWVLPIPSHLFHQEKIIVRSFPQGMIV